MARPDPVYSLVFPVFTADSAPKDGTEILAWWPLVQLDDDGNLTDLPVEGDRKGAWVPTSRSGGSWDEPDWFDAVGDWFGDDYCYAPDPTHWTYLPGDPAKGGAA